MNFTERIPLNRFEELSALKYDTYKSMGSFKTDKECKESFQYFKNYVKMMRKVNGEMVHIYKHVDDQKGRLFSGTSIQGKPKYIRGYLLHDITTDIDMINAHPAILLYLCIKHEIPHANLKNYVENRSAILEKGSATKQDYLKAVNSEKKNTKIEDAVFREFDKEMKTIQKSLLPHYPNIKTTKTYNENGSMVNHILCHYENEILQILIDTISKKSIEICALMFDGLMVYGDYYNDQNLLEELESAIKEYGICLSYKEHNTDLVIDGEPDPITLSEHEMALKVLELFPHWKYCTDLYVFDTKSGLWTKDNAIQLNIIHSLLVSITGSLELTARKMSAVCIHIQGLTYDADWLNKKANSSLGYVCFNNGYVDKFGKLHPFDPSIVFMNKINRDYIKGNSTYCNSILERFFTIPLGDDIGRCYLQRLSMALFGETMKNIYFCLGETDTGKSTIVKALTKSCADLVGTFNAESLSVKDTSQDEAQQMRWAFLLRYKRIIFSNELSMTAKLNGNMLKKISSGGDDLVGRTHCANETKFRPHFIAFIFANDICEIKPYDTAVDNRLRVVPYTKKYTENPSETELLRDDNLEKEMETEEFQQAFISLLINTYVEYFAYGKMEDPDGMKHAKKSWVVQEANILNKFLEDFEITNNPEHYVTCSEIRTWNEENKTGVSDTSMGRDLTAHALKHKMEHVVCKVKKLNSKSTRIWSGIRLNERDLMI
jgi:hypothetical protein